MREAVINAVIHRDYASTAPIQIRVYDHRITLWNPGQLPPDWSVEQLTGEHSSRPHNPGIAYAFFRAGMIEAWGRGIRRIAHVCETAGNPAPEWKIEPGGGLWLEFPYSAAYRRTADSLLKDATADEAGQKRHVSGENRGGPGEAIEATTQETGSTTQETEETTQEDDRATTQETRHTTQEVEATTQETGRTTQETEGTTQEDHRATTQETGHTTQEVEATTQETGSTTQEIEETTQEDHRATTQETGHTTQEAEATTQERILALLEAEPEITRRLLAERIGITADGVKYHLDKLRAAGVIRHVGATRAGRWEVLQ